MMIPIDVHVFCMRWNYQSAAQRAWKRLLSDVQWQVLRLHRATCLGSQARQHWFERFWKGVAPWWQNGEIFWESTFVNKQKIELIKSLNHCHKFGMQQSLSQQCVQNKKPWGASRARCIGSVQVITAFEIPTESRWYWTNYGFKSEAVFFRTFPWFVGSPLQPCRGNVQRLLAPVRSLWVNSAKGFIGIHHVSPSPSVKLKVCFRLSDLAILELHSVLGMFWCEARPVRRSALHPKLLQSLLQSDQE